MSRFEKLEWATIALAVTIDYPYGSSTSPSCSNAPVMRSKQAEVAVLLLISEMDLDARYCDGHELYLAHDLSNWTLSLSWYQTILDL